MLTATTKNKECRLCKGKGTTRGLDGKEIRCIRCRGTGRRSGYQVKEK